MISGQDTLTLKYKDAGGWEEFSSTINVIQRADSFGYSENALRTTITYTNPDNKNRVESITLSRADRYAEDYQGYTLTRVATGESRSTQFNSSVRTWIRDSDTQSPNSVFSSGMKWGNQNLAFGFETLGAIVGGSYETDT
ncbi:MAG: hypothetical protein WCJ71_09075, partial [Candidatus Omnitrophota bacterium]